MCVNRLLLHPLRVFIMQLGGEISKINLMCLLAGTRIIYDRKFLLDRRNSPIAQTPPAHLPVIPGVTSLHVLNENQKNEANNHIKNHEGKPATGGSYTKRLSSLLFSNVLHLFFEVATFR